MGTCFHCVGCTMCCRSSSSPVEDALLHRSRDVFAARLGLIWAPPDGIDAVLLFNDEVELVKPLVCRMFPLVWSPSTPGPVVSVRCPVVRAARGVEVSMLPGEQVALARADGWMTELFQLYAMLIDAEVVRPWLPRRGETAPSMPDGTAGPVAVERLQVSRRLHKG